MEIQTKMKVHKRLGDDSKIIRQIYREEAYRAIFSGSRAGRNGEGNGSAQGGLGVCINVGFILHSTLQVDFRSFFNLFSHTPLVTNIACSVSCVLGSLDGPWSLASFAFEYN